MKLEYQGPLPTPSSSKPRTALIQWEDVHKPSLPKIGDTVPITILKASNSVPLGLPGYVKIGADVPAEGRYVIEIGMNDTPDCWLRPNTQLTEPGVVFTVMPAWWFPGQDSSWVCRCVRVS